jgi:general stress protein 26
MANDHETNAERVWEIVEKTGICMMTTRFDRGLRARPLEARPDRDAGVIWFLTDVRGLKDDEVEANPEVCLTFVYSKEKVYLSITGEAFVSRSRARESTLEPAAAGLVARRSRGSECARDAGRAHAS